MLRTVGSLVETITTSQEKERKDIQKFHLRVQAIVNKYLPSASSSKK